MHHQLPVARHQDIELDGVDAQFATVSKRRQRVFRHQPGSPTMADNERFFRRGNGVRPGRRLSRRTKDDRHKRESCHQGRRQKISFD